MPDPSDQVFTQIFIDKIFDDLNEGRAVAAITKEQIEESLAIAVQSGVAQICMFFPPSNPTVTGCEMPNNAHVFTGSGKTCKNPSCGKTFCRKHAISNCVVCGQPL
jgi:hypothetical protein